MGVPILPYRHQRAAFMITQGVVRYFKVRGYQVLRDDTQHVAIKLVDGTLLSVYCSGYDKRLDVAKLTKSGEINYRYRERSYTKPATLIRCVEALNRHLEK